MTPRISSKIGSSSEVIPATSSNMGVNALALRMVDYRIARQNPHKGGTMATSVNREFVLASRPTGQPSKDNFRLVEAPVPTPGTNQVLVRAHYLSVDPYLRIRMSEDRSY